MSSKGCKTRRLFILAEHQNWLCNLCQVRCVSPPKQRLAPGVYFRLKDNTATIDHIVPKAQGGTSERHNLQMLCRLCNSGKEYKEFRLRRSSFYMQRLLHVL